MIQVLLVSGFAFTFSLITHNGLVEIIELAMCVVRSSDGYDLMTPEQE